MSLRDSIRALVSDEDEGGKEAEKGKDVEKKAAEETPAATAQAQAKSFAEAVEKLRRRNDLAGKGIATVGASVVSGLGVAKFFDVYPYPDEAGDWWIPLLGGFLAMAAGVAGLAMSYFRLQRAILMVSELPEDPSGRFSGFHLRSPATLDPLGLRVPWAWRDPTSPMDLNARELRFVRDIYERNARLNDLDSLVAYEARGNRLQRIAPWLEPDQAKEARDEANVIASEVYAIFKRAQHAVLLDRTSRVATNPLTWLCILLVFGGLALSSLSSDRVISARDEGATAQLEFLSDCATTASGGVDQSSKQWVATGCPGVDPPE